MHFSMYACVSVFFIEGKTLSNPKGTKILNLFICLFARHVFGASECAYYSRTWKWFIGNERHRTQKPISKSCAYTQLGGSGTNKKQMMLLLVVLMWKLIKWKCRSIHEILWPFDDSQRASEYLSPMIWCPTKRTQLKWKYFVCAVIGHSSCLNDIF